MHNLARLGAYAQITMLLVSIFQLTVLWAGLSLPITWILLGVCGSINQFALFLLARRATNVGPIMGRPVTRRHSHEI